MIDCVCVSKKTSPISPAKLGEPILLGFCTTTQLRDVIVYSGRRLNTLAILYLRGGGVEFSVFPYTLVMVSNTAYCTTVHTRET